ncbi:hypothetical protein [Alienimonas chondri]|uniref:Uncharacterized protein n=1 Tax=Alienimonas chondri TaxID=2681879 RepID=A0ABX1VJ20_9PLAN|nr:hypothetical protein [Alienimonas chondri]NNJ27227.1 hypothetical protein [Alienimonas chondri]
MPLSRSAPPPDVDDLIGSLGTPFGSAELSVLRRQVAAVRAASQRAGTFRGFRSLTVGFSAVAAVATGWFAPLPEELVIIDGVPIVYAPDAWVVVAGLCFAVAAGEMLWRAKGSSYGLAMVWTAAGQFLPCVAAGAAVTFVAQYLRPELLLNLPGLWALLFGLGVCSCARLLPRAFWAIGAWYLTAGCIGLAAPRLGAGMWFLPAVFGIGQGATAGLLYLLVERPERLAGRHEGWGELDDPADLFSA